MIEKSSDLFSRGEEFLKLFKNGADFTKELLVENERLRGRLSALEEDQAAAAQTPEAWGKYRGELLAQLHDLEEEYEGVRLRLQQVEEENQQFAARHLEIEEDNNNLANLYVASYQLHSTLDLDEVLKIIVEIVIKLVGAEIFAVYLQEGNSNQFGLVRSEGADAKDFPACVVGEGVLGTALEASGPTCSDPSQEPNLEQPIVCIPLIVHGGTIGAIAIYGLLQQKEGFSALDHELFSMLGGHAATALFSARLYSESERRLNTIQGFIDLLTK